MGDLLDEPEISPEVVVELEWLDEPGARTARPSDPIQTSIPKPSPLAWAVAGVVVVVFVVVALNWIAGGASDAPASPVDEASGEPTPTVVEAVDVEELDFAATIEGLTQADLNTAFIVTHARVGGGGADMFATFERLAAMPGGYRIAYIGADGHPVVIDTGAGEIISITEERRATSTEGLELLFDGRGMLGLDPDDLSVAWRVTNDARLVRGADGSLTIIAVDGVDREVGEFTLGEVSDRTPIPASAHVVLLDGIGVFVLPQSGGGFVVDGGELRQVTPHRLRSAGEDHILIRTRGSAERVDMIVDLESGEEVVLDPELIDLGGDLLLSPDGEWVVVSNRDDDGPPALYAPRTGEVLVFDRRTAYRHGVWSPGSSYVAALDDDMIWLEFLNGSSAAITIGVLGIPAAEDSPIVVF